MPQATLLVVESLKIAPCSQTGDIPGFVRADGQDKDGLGNLIS